MIDFIINGFFFLVLYAPFHFYTIKAPFFFLIIFLIFFKTYFHNFTFSVKKEILLLTLYYMVIGLFFLLIGLDEAGDHALKYLVPLYVLYPLLFFYIIIGITQKNIYSLLRIMLYSIVAISIYNTLYILMLIGYLPKYTFIMSLGVAQNATISTHGTQIASVALSTLVFAVPFLIALVLSGREIKPLHLKRFFYVFILVIGLFGVLLSGRRALILTTLLSIITYYFYISFLPKYEFSRIMKKHIKKIMLIFMTIFIFMVLLILFNGIDLSNFIDKILKFDPESDNVRIQQAISLINGWFSNPLFGYGHGTYTDIIRSEKPWRYELSYLALLFHTGIIGLILYSVGIIWIYYNGVKIIKKGGDSAIIMIALLNGLTAMLISYATNPYFDALDILWVIFLPVAYINIHSTKKSHQNAI